MWIVYDRFLPRFIPPPKDFALSSRKRTYYSILDLYLFRMLRKRGIANFLLCNFHRVRVWILKDVHNRTYGLSWNQISSLLMYKESVRPINETYQCSQTAPSTDFLFICMLKLTFARFFRVQFVTHFLESFFDRFYTLWTFFHLLMSFTA